MTYAAVPALRHAPELARRFEPLLASRAYDPGLRPPQTKAGLLSGMAMTEKQGGSDVRAGTTRAEPAPSAGDGAHLLTGHKWFNSAPMCDLFLVLAQGPDGLTCYLLPRVLPDGTRNAMRIQRLKDKLGNRSNASAEVEYDGALAWQVGEPGRGMPTIIDMVTATRLDCVLGSAAAMRRATVAAVHHCAHRQAFGKNLIDQPLMTCVLADLAVESEAATALAIRLAGAAQRAAGGDAAEAALLRVALPAAKYWVCKRAVTHAAEALECHGGNGYVEESGLPGMYREAPLNSIWEGSGNVTALDVLRALRRSPASAAALLAELDLAAGGDKRLDEATAELRRMLAGLAALAETGPGSGRRSRGVPGPAAGRPDRLAAAGRSAGAARAAAGGRRVLRLPARIGQRRRPRLRVRHAARRPGADARHRPRAVQRAARQLRRPPAGRLIGSQHQRQRAGHRGSSRCPACGQGAGVIGGGA